MNVNTFCNTALTIATKYKTLYVNGCFGAPMTMTNKLRYSTNNSYNRGRASMIMSATSDTFGFDCVCLIKAILGGWNGNKNDRYGGTIVNKEIKGISYGSLRVPDYNADSMITHCTEVSTYFGNIKKGEAVWLKGHIGIYIGNGQVVECTPKWENKVQVTNLGNISQYRKGNYRTWTKHGKLPWVEYDTEDNTTQYHIVKKDETLSLIAKMYGYSSYKDLLPLNPSITNPNKIYPNQMIRVR